MYGPAGLEIVDMSASSSTQLALNTALQRDIVVSVRDKLGPWQADWLTAETLEHIRTQKVPREELLVMEARANSPARETYL